MVVTSEALGNFRGLQIGHLQMLFLANLLASAEKTKPNTTQKNYTQWPRVICNT